MRKVGLALLGVGVSSFLGCTAILGTFEVTPSSATLDGSSDGPATDGPTDAGDADAIDPSLYLLTCNIDESKTRAIDFAPNGYARRPFAAFNLTGGGGQKPLRIIVHRDGIIGDPAQMPSFTALTFAPDSPGLPVDVKEAPTAAGQALDAVRLVGSKLGVLTFDRPVVGEGYARLWVIEDGAGINVSPVDLSQKIDLTNPNNFHVSGQVIPLAADDYFVALSYPVGSVGQQDWAAGRKAPAQLPPDLTQHVIRTFPSGGGGETDLQSAFRVTPRVYLFDGAGPEGTTPKSTTFYVVPDDGNVGANPGTSLSAGGGKSVLTLAGAANQSSLSIAVGELDTAPGSATPLIMRAGRISGAKLGHFTGADVPVIATYSGFADLPFGNDGPATRFVTPDDLVGLGSGPSPGAKGLNLLWYNLGLGAMRAKNTGSAKLLPNRVIDRAIVVPDGTIDGLFANFQVIWTESATDGGLGQTLFSAKMACVK